MPRARTAPPPAAFAAFLLVPTLILLLFPRPAPAHPADPPPLQRYARTLQTISSLSVVVTLVDADNQSTDKATLAFARPNQFKLVSHSVAGQFAEAVSDGTDLREWDRRSTKISPAPPRLGRLDLQFPIGPAAQLACAVFLTRDALGEPSAWRTVARVKMQGIAVDKIASGDTATAWLAAATGLPLRLAVHDEANDFVADFRYPGLGRPLSASTFDAAAPAGTRVLQSFQVFSGPFTWVPDMALGTHRIYVVACLVRTTQRELAGLGISLKDGPPSAVGLKNLQDALRRGTMRATNVRQFSTREDTVKDLAFGTQWHPISITLVPRMARGGRVALEVTEPVQETVQTAPGRTALMSLSDPDEGNEDTLWLLMLTPTVRGG